MVRPGHDPQSPAGACSGQRESASARPGPSHRHWSSLRSHSAAARSPSSAFPSRRSSEQPAWAGALLRGHHTGGEAASSRVLPWVRRSFSFLGSHQRRKRGCQMPGFQEVRLTAAGQEAALRPPCVLFAFVGLAETHSDFLSASAVSMPTWSKTPSI